MGATFAEWRHFWRECEKHVFLSKCQKEIKSK